MTCYSGSVSLARPALLGLLLAAVTAAPSVVAPAEADESHAAPEASGDCCEEECPSDCPPGCNDACICCVRVRADALTLAVRVPPPTARLVAFARVAQAIPPSAELDLRDPVPRAAV